MNADLRKEHPHRDQKCGASLSAWHRLWPTSPEKQISSAFSCRPRLSWLGKGASKLSTTFSCTLEEMDIYRDRRRAVARAVHSPAVCNNGAVCRSHQTRLERPFTIIDLGLPQRWIFSPRRTAVGSGHAFSVHLAVQPNPFPHQCSRCEGEKSVESAP